MAFPKRGLIPDALLLLLYQGRGHARRSDETYRPLADHFGLTPEDLTQQRKFKDDRQEAQWNNVVQWAREKLCGDGLVHRPVEGERSIWRLTEAGIQRARALGSQFIVAEPPTPEASDLSEPPERVKMTTYRILRDTAIARRVKALHGHRCQVCGLLLEGRGGRPYAEAHHIRPLGAPHHGPDSEDNVVCVCPNCHAQLDQGAIVLDLDRMRAHPEHRIDALHVAYHNKTIVPGPDIEPTEPVQSRPGRRSRKR